MTSYISGARDGSKAVLWLCWRLVAFTKAYVSSYIEKEELSTKTLSLDGSNCRKFYLVPSYYVVEVSREGDPLNMVREKTGFWATKSPVV